MGQQEEQTKDELREVIKGSKILLRQKHHPEDGGQALRLQVRLRPAVGAGIPTRGGPVHARARAAPRQVLNFILQNQNQILTYVTSPPDLSIKTPFLLIYVLNWSLPEVQLTMMQLEPKMYRNLP